ncbi:MAG: hypothetical protein IPM54_10580 [Polyangiaceae bacterium]|nr:hypothetical protein [Polyangiaceae bacterium]
MAKSLRNPTRKPCLDPSCAGSSTPLSNLVSTSDNACASGLLFFQGLVSDAPGGAMLVVNIAGKPFWQEQFGTL